MQRARPRLAKLTRPRLHAPVPRARLFDVLDAAAQERKAILVVGPPGAGKTTLVASWLDARDLPGLWYQVDDADAEAATLFHYLALAALPFVPSAQRPLPRLTSEYARDVIGFARRFFRDLFELLPTPSVLVLDNYQDAGLGDTFHAVVVEAIQQLPEQINLIVISRAELPAAHARLVASQNVAFVEWDALKLTLDETREIASMRGGMEEAAVHMLHRYSGGWAAGVTLMLERMRRTGVVNRLSDAASMETVFNYFASQLLTQIEPSAQSALMKCAVFRSLSAKLAASMTGDARTGPLLDELYRRHLFIDRRHDMDATYELHALFRAFLLHRLADSASAGEIAGLKRRAATLVEAEGRVDEARTLYAEAEDWSGVTGIVVREAAVVLGQGRARTLREWIEAIPEKWVAQHPWLAYWHGQALLADDLLAARKAFVLAVEGHEHRGDIVGQIVAMAGIMESYYFFWSLFPRLDPWIERMCVLLDQQPGFPGAEMEMRAYAALVMATHHRAPRSRWLGRAIERLRALLEADLSDDRKVQAGCMLIGYAQAGSNLPLALSIVGTVTPIVERNTISPLSRCMWLARLGLHLSHRGIYEDAIAAIDQAEALAAEHGIAVDGVLRAFWGVLATLGVADLARASSFVRRLEERARPDRPLEAGMAHYCRCMLASAEGDVAAALESGRAAIRISSAEGVFWLQAYATGSAVWAMLDAGQLDEAVVTIASLRRLIEGSFMAPYAAEIELCEAAVAAGRGDAERTHAHLREAARIGRQTGYVFVNRAMPTTLRKVMGKAMRVDAAFFGNVIRTYRPWPGPEGDEAWPWPLRLRLLGGLEILIDGKPPVYSRKMPRKVLALLCAIVSLGGADVAEERVLDALWPDEEGDAAYGALTASVRRLRELLGRKGAVRHVHGRLGLDPVHCWVDVRAFERAIEAGDDASLAQAMHLYRGPLLPDETAAWAIPVRQRLRARFTDAVLACGQRAEAAGRHADALAVYRGGVQTDDLAEPFYQGLMRCLQRLERLGEALDAYDRLRQALAAAGAVPSAASDQLYCRLRGS